MGYESRVHIVNEWDDVDIRDVDEEIGKPLGEIIARFDLCSWYTSPTLLNNQHLLYDVDISIAKERKNVHLQSV